MVTVVLACALVAGLRVPADWMFDRIDFAEGEGPAAARPMSGDTWSGDSVFYRCDADGRKLRAYFRREVDVGKPVTLTVPDGCQKGMIRVEAAGGDKVRVTGKRPQQKPDPNADTIIP